MFGVDEFIARCHDALDSPSPIAETEHVIIQMLLDSGAVVETFEGLDDGRLVLYESEDLSIQHLSLRPLMRTELYMTNWMVMGLIIGHLEQFCWAQSPQGIKPVGSRLVSVGDVVRIEGGGVQSLFNPCETGAAVLQVYGGRIPSEHSWLA